MNFSPRAVLYMKSYLFLKYFVNGSSYQILRCAMLYPWLGVRKYWLSMLSSLNQRCVIDNSLTSFPRSKRWMLEITENVYKKHQIIFVRKKFARDKTQSMQWLSTPFNWKCLTWYSSSLILKITIFSAFTKKHQ